MNNTELRLLVGLTIAEGQLELFKTRVLALIEKVETTESTTISYEWFINDTGNKCYVSESFSSSEAFLSHSQNSGSALGPVLELAPITEMIVFGNPNSEVVAALSEHGAQFLAFEAGFSR